MRKDDEFDFKYVEFVRMVGSLNVGIEEVVGNVVVKFTGKVRIRYIELGIIYV